MNASEIQQDLLTLAKRFHGRKVAASAKGWTTLHPTNRGKLIRYAEKTYGITVGLSEGMGIESITDLALLAFARGKRIEMPTTPGAVDQ